MKTSGFTIIKNAIINDYPIVEAITSILPVVDEMIVLAGDSSDATKELIQSINSEKIKIFDSVWDKTLRKGGEVLAVETDKAFQLIDKKSTWAFYIQADEVVHERYLPAIIEGCKKHKDDLRVEGLLFKYRHFYGTYDYIGDSRTWYTKEVRIIRNDKRIHSYKDAQGFRMGRRKLHVKQIDAEIYHYGWVKSPEQMKRKIKEVSRYWHEDSEDWRNLINSEDFFNFEDFESLEKFTGAHPLVMNERIKRHNYNYRFDTTKKNLSVKDRILYRFEKLTGKRLFDFTNYKILK
jgi:hypothetical protein